MDSRLHDLREDRNLLQKDIVKILEINQQTYSAWETGNKVIPLKYLNTLCNYYNMSMDYVLKLSNIKNFNNINFRTKLNKSDIGRRLKEIRNITKLSLRKLAFKLNTTSFAYQICKDYNISLDYLCCKKDNISTSVNKV